MEMFINNNILIISLSLIVSIISAIFVSILIFRSDLKLVPWKSSSIMFASMIIAVAVSVIIEKYLSNITTNSSLQYYMWAIVEEVVKLIPVYLIIFLRKFSKNSEIIIYAVISALGFAVFENAFFIYGNLKETYIFDASMLVAGRATCAMLVHIISSFIFISCVVLIKQKGKYLIGIVTGLVVAVTFHASFNILLIYYGNSTSNFGILILSLWLLFCFFILAFEKVKHIVDQTKFVWKPFFKKIGGFVILIVIFTIVNSIIKVAVPKYTQQDIDYWGDELATLETSQKSWAEFNNDKYSNKVNYIVSEHNYIIKDVQSIIDEMLLNKYLSHNQQEFIKNYKDKIDKIVAFQDETNLKINKDYFEQALKGIEEVRPSWKSLKGPVYIKNKVNIDRINMLTDLIVEDIKSILNSISNGEKLDYAKLIIKHEQMSKEFNDLTEKVNSSR